MAENSLVIKQVAWYRAQGLTQTEIGEKLNLPQGTICRYLKQAIDEGMIIVNRLPVLRLTEEDRMVVQQSLTKSRFQNELQRLSGGTLKTVLYVEIGDLESLSTPEKASRDEHFKRFGELAGQYTADEILPHASTVAVAWGMTLFSVCRQLERCWDARKNKKKILFVQSCGDPQDVQTDSLRKSSTLVSLLHKTVNQSTNNPYAFSLPASVPPEFKAPGKWETVQDFIKSSMGFRNVFVDETSEGHISRCDTLLTSLGSNKADDPWLHSVCREANVDMEELSRATVGNIAGLWLPDPDAEDTSLLDDVNSRWIGIREHQIEAIAARCVELGQQGKNVPGTVGYCFGQHKARVVIETVRRKLVNRLILDESLALSIARELGVLDDEPEVRELPAYELLEN